MQRRGGRGRAPARMRVRPLRWHTRRNEEKHAAQLGEVHRRQRLANSVVVPPCRRSVHDRRRRHGPGVPLVAPPGLDDLPMLCGTARCHGGRCWYGHIYLLVVSGSRRGVHGEAPLTILTTSPARTSTNRSSARGSKTASFGREAIACWRRPHLAATSTGFSGVIHAGIDRIENIRQKLAEEASKRWRQARDSRGLYAPDHYLAHVGTLRVMPRYPRLGANRTLPQPSSGGISMTTCPGCVFFNNPSR